MSSVAAVGRDGAGNGGAGDHLDGSPAACRSSQQGAGGGGAAGLIRIGAFDAKPVVDANAGISPSVKSGATTYYAISVE